MKPLPLRASVESGSLAGIYRGTTYVVVLTSVAAAAVLLLLLHEFQWLELDSSEREAVARTQAVHGLQICLEALGSCEKSRLLRKRNKM